MVCAMVFLSVALERPGVFLFFLNREGLGKISAAHGVFCADREGIQFFFCGVKVCGMMLSAYREDACNIML